MRITRGSIAVLFFGLTFGGSFLNAQTDVALSLYGAFSAKTTGNGVEQSPANAAGALIEVRHISHPLIGFEGTYAYNRANQTYIPSPYTCPVGDSPCPPTAAAISANAHEVTGDYLASVKIANLRPFALAGVGLLFNQPASGQADTMSSNKPVFVYGAGLDWGLIPHLGIRLQYRGNLYKAPELTNVFTSSGAFVRTAEPVVGAYLRF
jgi:hypothetical protein